MSFKLDNRTLNLLILTALDNSLQDCKKKIIFDTLFNKFYNIDCEQCEHPKIAYFFAKRTNTRKVFTSEKLNIDETLFFNNDKKNTIYKYSLFIIKLFEEYFKKMHRDEIVNLFDNIMCIKIDKVTNVLIKKLQKINKTKNYGVHIYLNNLIYLLQNG